MTQPESTEPKSLKGRIQESPQVFFLASVVTGFLSGIGAYKGILEIAQIKTISSQTYDKLHDDNHQLATELQDAKQQNAALQGRLKNLSSGGEKPHQASELAPNLRAVDDFMNTPPLASYQWQGLAFDNDKLNSFVQQFLDSLQARSITYSEAAAFYDAVNEAGTEVCRRAQRTFELPKESGSGMEQKLNYDQKVFLGPAWFLIRVQELRLRHMQGALRREEIEDFRGKFNDWRKNYAGI